MQLAKELTIATVGVVKVSERNSFDAGLSAKFDRSTDMEIRGVEKG